MIITLTTDFGYSDTYVAQMKGVILGVNPAAQFVDVTHQVPAQNVRRASETLNEIVDAFPPGTIHVVVVDPGVGSERHIVAVNVCGQRFVVPDNGILSGLVQRESPTSIVIIEPERVRNALGEIQSSYARTSNTFHGRDVMAPAAAFWSVGREPTDFGALSSEPLKTISDPVPSRKGSVIHGEVRWIDSFGNLVTNISHAMLSEQDPQQLTIDAGTCRIQGVRQFYEQEPVGSVLALIGSSGYLEIAVNQGNAAKTLDARIGDAVRISIDI